MEIYLDNSATTKICKSSADAMMSAITDNWGNPSSIHKKGINALNALNDARQALADLIKASAEEIYFSPSGTVANNTAIFGAVNALKKRGNRIVTTALEHPSVGEAMKRLEQQGFEVIRLPAARDGSFSPTDLINAINKNTILVSIMAVNNEIGTIYPISLIKQAVLRADSPALVHVDAIQALGKIELTPQRMGIDLMSMSAHKLHGPKGVGALYIKKGTRITPHILGGGQENGIFSGTQPMPAIIGFGAAVKALPNIKKQAIEVQGLRDYFVENVTKIGGVHINSPSNALPYIINLSVLGVPSQTMVNALSEMGIYVSAGSACKKGHRSEVLTAIGIEPNFIDSAIRISLSRDTTRQELISTVEAIDSVVKRIRR